MKVKMDTGGWKPYHLSDEEVERMREGLRIMEQALRTEFEAERRRNVMPEEYRNRVLD